jgi:hypothetical protein
MGSSDGHELYENPAMNHMHRDWKFILGLQLHPESAVLSFPLLAIGTVDKAACHSPTLQPATHPGSIRPFRQDMFILVVSPGVATGPM